MESKLGSLLIPGTPVKMIQDCLPYIDLILIMTVEPGFYRQNFVKSGLERLIGQRVDWLISDRIGSGWGVNTGNIERLSDIGVNICVAGSTFYSKTTNQMKTH